MKYASGEKPQVGDVVECVEKRQWLTIGKSYTVIKIDEGRVKALDDSKNTDHFFPSFFKLLSRAMPDDAPKTLQARFDNIEAERDKLRREVHSLNIRLQNYDANMGTLIKNHKEENAAMRETIRDYEDALRIINTAVQTAVESVK